MSTISGNQVFFHKVSFKNLFPKLFPPNFSESHHLILNRYLTSDNLWRSLTEEEEKGSFLEMMTLKRMLEGATSGRHHWKYLPSIFPPIWLPSFLQNWVPNLCSHQHDLKISFVCRGVLYKCLYKEILPPLLETKSRPSVDLALCGKPPIWCG